MFFEEAVNLLEQGHQQIVLEAFFSELQRRRAQHFLRAAGINAEIRWIWCHAPREVCERRVLSAAGLDGPERSGARLQLVRSVP
eukprot:scaffold220873_cov17-Tisochrysis_lutea.AAC.1